jgi:hypothetical protein
MSGVGALLPFAAPRRDVRNLAMSSLNTDIAPGRHLTLTGSLRQATE